MKLLSGLVSEISSVVDTLAVSSKEKKQIEADLVAAIARQEEALSQSLIADCKNKRNICPEYACVQTTIEGSHLDIVVGKHRV